MATTKLGNTKSASRAINYAEKRAVVKSGHNLDADYAKSQLKATRALYGKKDGIQAHTIIQSFKPEETTPEQANEIGLELAEKVAGNHQVAVYTHADTDHIHNHIVVGSIDLESGKKYQSNAVQRHFVKNMNDVLCRDHGLSIVEERNAGVRHTLAEQELIGKGQASWKDEIREAVDKTKANARDFDSFTSQLEARYGIETKLRGNTLSFKHPDRQRFVRANKLGFHYEKEVLDREFTREAGRGKSVERTFEGNQGTEQDNDGLHTGADGQESRRRHDDREPIEPNPREQRQDHRQHELHFREAERIARERKQHLSAGFDRWTEENARSKQRNGQEAKRTGEKQQQSVKQHERGTEKEHEPNRDQHQKRRERSKTREQGLSL